MKIGELKDQIMNLAFEEAASMQEYRQIVLEAINRAIGIIHTTVRPITSSYEIMQDGKMSGMIRYPMRELVPDFMGFTGEFELSRLSRYMKSFPHEIVDRDILILDGEIDGLYTVWYKRTPKQITEETPDEEELELDSDLHVLVPLLASFYVWLDDDERKAVMYYNQYDDLKQQIIASGLNPTVRIEGGVRW